MPKAETEDVPVVCERCLSSKEHIRMVRDLRGALCKLCGQPFVVFRWKVSAHLRNSTKICRACALRIGSCQSCMLDLSYGLPLPLRDAALNLTTQPGSNAIIQKFKAQKSENGFQNTQDFAKLLLENLAKGFYSDIQHGDGGAVSQKSNFPVMQEVKQAIASLPFKNTILGPHNTNGSMFIMGVEPDVDEDHIRSKLNDLALLSKLVLVRKARCGFVEFEGELEAAKVQTELASVNGRVIVDGNRLLLVWGEFVPIPACAQKYVGLFVRRFLRAKLRMTRATGLESTASTQPL